MGVPVEQDVEFFLKYTRMMKDIFEIYPG
jgi:hypothetical protein